MQIDNKILLAGDITSMHYSGSQGGNPVLSRSGLSSIKQFMCFQSAIDRENPYSKHDFGNFDLRKVPIELIKEKIKLELQGKDDDVINMFLEAQRLEYQNSLGKRRSNKHTE